MKEGTMRAFVCVLLLGLLSGIAIADTNVTGKWLGSFKMIGQDSDGHDSTAVLLLKQNGSEITGTAGPDEGEQHTITKGKIEGDKITILVEDDGHTVTFALVATADRITGDVNIVHDGQTRKAKLDVTRSK
jgi:hypothetical protein